MEKWCFRTTALFNAPCPPLWVFREKRTPERCNSSTRVWQVGMCDIWTNRTSTCMVCMLPRPCLPGQALHPGFVTASHVCLPKPMQASHRSSADHNIQSWVVHLWHTRHPRHLRLDSDSNSPAVSPLGQCVFRGAPLWLSQSSTGGTWLQTQWLRGSQCKACLFLVHRVPLGLVVWPVE